MEYVTLNNGVKMPQLGYGVYQVTKDECERCVSDALKIGYRLIDTAQSYFNEEEVGNAIAKSAIPRDEIFLTTKVWIEHYGYERAKASVLESMRKLQVDYLDLCLLHQPFSDAYGAYRALEKLYDEGKIHAIGISNFYTDRMVDFASFNRIKPMVNQVEIHPHNQQTEAKAWHDKYGIQMEAWAPFGEGQGDMFHTPELQVIAEKYGKSVAQVILIGFRRSWASAAFNRFRSSVCRHNSRLLFNSDCRMVSNATQSCPSSSPDTDGMVKSKSFSIMRFAPSMRIASGSFSFQR